MSFCKEIYKSVGKRIFNNCFYNNLQTPKYRQFFQSNILNKTVSFNLADIGEGIKDVVVKEWFVKIGDKVSQFDNICEVQSDKASVTITSRYDGQITKIYHEVDSVALVGQPLIDLEVENENEVVSSNSQDNEQNSAEVIVPSSTSKINPSSNEIICIPSVRRLAKEYKLNLEEIKGTGKHNRILKEDVLKYLEERTTKENSPLVEDREHSIPVQGFQKAMVKTMTNSLSIPHFVYSDELKVTELSNLRKSLRNNPDINLKLSFMPFFIKAASIALLKYPIINASVDQNCEKIIYKKSHNIGVAMDTKVGLAVPVVKNVENKSIQEIGKELKRLMDSGKDGQFSPKDLDGGTFTISNIGVIGGTYTKPVILQPQVSIIALGCSRIIPRFNQDMEVIPEEIINISAAADHRIIDGATMANFINLLKKHIENPYLIFINS